MKDVWSGNADTDKYWAKENEVSQCLACGEYVDYCQGHGDDNRYYREFVDYQIAIGNLSPTARDMVPDTVVYQWEQYTGESYV